MAVRGAFARRGRFRGNSAGPIAPPSNTPFLVIIGGHQSNLVGGQTVATGATFVYPDDSPVSGLWQWSPNGGGSGVPAQTNVLLQATNPLLYTALLPTSGTVGPSFAYAKAVLAASAPGTQICIITAGKGGTSLTEWITGTPLFTAMQTSWLAFLAAYPNSTLHSILMSPMENEMSNNIAYSAAFTSMGQVISSYRGMTGAANTPIYFGSPTAAYVQGPTYRALMSIPALYAVSNPHIGYSGALVGGQVPPDIVHYTNASNRIRGGWLFNQIANTVTFNNAAAPQVAAASIANETVTFTSVGVPYYDVQWRAAGSSGAWTSTTYVPKQDNAAGQVFIISMPGTGSRDCRIVAKAFGGDATPSATLNYTLPVTTVPARTTELDFNGAPVDGSGNMTSVSSIGTDTTVWTPAASGGQGALALIKKQTVNGLGAALVDSANKHFLRTGVLTPGDYSIAIPFLYQGAQSNGLLLCWGQNSTAGDIYLQVPSDGSVRMGHNSVSTVQLATTTTPLGNDSLNRWQFLLWTYNRTTNTGTIYYNGVAQPVTGTLSQRSASPANSGGTDFNGFNIDSTANGFPNMVVPTFMHWAQELTAAQVVAVQALLESTYALQFGQFGP